MISYYQRMKRLKLIPTLQLLFRIVLGGLLAFAGLLKLQDNSALFESVAYLPWIPILLKSVIIDTLPWIEVLVGSLLVFNVFGKVVKPAAGIIYLGFFIFAIYGLGAGIEGDCGCFGDLDDSSLIGALLGSEFGWRMVIRNAIFLGMAVFLFLPSETPAPDEG